MPRAAVCARSRPLAQVPQRLTVVLRDVAARGGARRAA
eukprot:gene280-3047_t